MVVDHVGLPFLSWFAPAGAKLLAGRFLPDDALTRR
jgi:hypothetical protein